MTFDSSPSLQKIEDAPLWVSNSVYLFTSQELTWFSLACHADIPPHEGVKGIRVLNAKTGPSVRIDFLHAAAIRVESWDSDAPNGHPLISLGLQKNVLYEVTRSPWISALANELVWSGASRLRHFVCAFRIYVYEIAAEQLRWQVFDVAPPVALSHHGGPPPAWR